MTGFELYTLVVCLFVYILFVVLFTILITWIVKQYVKQLRAGIEDEQIIKEFQQESNRSERNGFLQKVIPIFFCALFSVVFLFSTYSAITQDGKVGFIPTVKVVSSGSMADKYEGNDYLFDNNINNQIQVFDLVVLHKLPDEMDIQLYDIVVYEVDDVMVVHRVVGIEEPNDKHPNQRYFMLQGDNVRYPDKFPVTYSQMKSIYRDQKIPYVGSFVFFMQSPAGVLCFLLIISGVVAIYKVEKIILRERNQRIRIILEKQQNPAQIVTVVVTPNNQ